MSWRNATIVLALLCCWLTWKSCRRRAPQPTVEQCEKLLADSPSSSSTSSAASSDAAGASSTTADKQPALPAAGGHTFKSHGFALTVPDWAMRLGPQPGESLPAYRDRMMPLAKAAVGVHRSRVARGRDDFAEVAGLDSRQKAELDAAVQDAATAIQNRVFEAYGNGDFSLSTFKPMTGVTLARDVLDLVDQANKRFVASLREDQRGKLATHPFDIADYLVFSTQWEDALGL